MNLDITFVLAGMLISTVAATIWFAHRCRRLSDELIELRAAAQRHRDQAAKIGQELDNLLAQSKLLRELANRQDRTLAALQDRENAR